jgi:endoglucanase
VKVKDNVYKIINRKSNKALDMPESSKDQGVQLIQWDTHGEENQQWIVEKVGETWRIKSVASEHALDVEEDSKNEGAKIIQWSWHGNDNQRWKLEEVK